MSKEKTLKEKIAAAMPAIKKLLFNDEPPADPSKDKFMEAELADGTKITVDPELKEKATVSIIDADGNAVPAPDGEHTLKDGTKITVKDGLIESITPVEPAADAEMRKQVNDLKGVVDQAMKRLAEVETKFAAVSKENATLKSANVNFSKALTDTLALVQEMAEAPAAGPTELNVRFSTEGKTFKNRADEMVARHMEATKKTA